MSERVLRMPALEQKVGLKKSKIHDNVKKGLFPRPIPLTPRASGWLESEVDAWIATRTAAREPDAR
jgi:prophage regulatory protein